MSISRRVAAEGGDDRLGVGPRGRRRRAVRHQHAQQAVRADRLGRQVRDERRVDAAGEPEHGALEPGLGELAADEDADDAPGDVGVDGELGRELERRRRLEGRIGSAAGLRVGRGHASVRRRHRSASGHRTGPDGRTAARSLPARTDRGRTPLRRRHVQSGLSRRIGRGVGRHPGPLGHDPGQLPGLQLGPFVAQERQRDPLAADVGRLDVHREQAFLVERGAEHRRAGRGDDLRAAPEGDRLVDADAVAEHDEGGRQLRVRAHERPPRRRRPEPDLVGGRQVAARGRRDVDEDLGAVEGQELGHREVPEVLADGDPEADPEIGRRRPQHVAGREEPPLVEQPVRRQEQLAMDVTDLAVLEQGRRDEQAVVGRFLHERDDGRQAIGRRQQLAQPRVVEAHRHLAREILQLIPGQPELGEDDQLCPAGPGLAQEFMVPREVLVEGAQARCDLGQRDADLPHGLSIRDALIRLVTKAPLGARLPRTRRAASGPMRSRPAPDRAGQGGRRSGRGGSEEES